MEKVNMQVKGFPLIKFSSLERIKEFQKGKVYANTLSYFRNRENETGDRDIGDSFEAMLHVNEGYLQLEGSNKKISLRDALIKTTQSDMYVYCMFCILPNKEVFTFDDVQKEKMKSFGDTALLITDSNEFINRVKKAAENQGYFVKNNEVHYYDESEDNGNLIFSIFKDMKNIAFWKRKYYEYQQEYRFVFTNDEKVQDHIELNIGDISDISTILPVDQVLTSFVKKEITFM